ncbi:MAG: hypothetical protein R3D25_18610 [Geminicoccaceae bacterium]
MRTFKLLLASMLVVPGLLAQVTVLSKAAHAEPKPLDDKALGEVTGGLFDVYVVMPVVVVNNNNNAIATGVNSQNITADAVANVAVNPVINIQPTDMIGTMAPVVISAPLAGGIVGPDVIVPAITGSPLATKAISATPTWVPWAAELRSSLGVK